MECRNWTRSRISCKFVNQYNSQERWFLKQRHHLNSNQSGSSISDNQRALPKDQRRRPSFWHKRIKRKMKDLAPQQQFYESLPVIQQLVQWGRAMSNLWLHQHLTSLSLYQTYPEICEVISSLMLVHKTQQQTLQCFRGHQLWVEEKIGYKSMIQ